MGSTKFLSKLRFGLAKSSVVVRGKMRGLRWREKVRSEERAR